MGMSKSVLAKVLLGTLALFILSGCATMFKGSVQTIPVMSQPAGAEVIVDGVSYGNTPLQLRLKTNKTYVVTVRNDGKERTFTITNQIGTMWVVLDVLAGLVPVVVDAATGTWYELSPEQINVVLE